MASAAVTWAELQHAVLPFQPQPVQDVLAVKLSQVLLRVLLPWNTKFC